ncbi:MAG: HAMP domain-containing histidine kinase [Syntrophales bacterium]|jgi:two-component system NtrC family sensor kinase|nr:HAMP domain-containing histidine kinase [Syntrophales bacterium]
MVTRIKRIANSIGVKFFILLVFLLIIAFGVIIYVNVYLLTDHFRIDAVSNAVKVSNLIKRATYYSMLENRRSDLTNTIVNIGKEQEFRGIRIYNKIGVITFSDKPEEVGKVADKRAEQCYVCHAEEPAKGVVPTKDLTRTFTSSDGSRVMGLISPIENSPECFNAACHAHAPQDGLLGILDVKLSLKDGDGRIIVTRNKMILYSALLILITVLVKGYFIRRMIHNPIKKLNDATKEVANLNLEYRVEINSSDELGNLAKSFNNMTAQIREESLELEKTQAQLIMAEKMASMGELSAMVAHEINNPLSGILSYAKVSSRYLERGDNDPEALEAVRKNLAFISEETKRCGNIVKSLLIFSRRGSGDFKEEHLNGIIENSIMVIDHSVKMKELHLVKELGEGDDLIYCDAGGIQQVFVALIVNAIEATPPGGTIMITTDCTTLKESVVVTVSDTGKGIPDTIFPHIFEPFVSTKTKGTGLGLSVVYGIVQQHGGSIDVKTTVGEGAVFTVFLPRNPTAVGNDNT